MRRSCATADDAAERCAALFFARRTESPCGELGDINMQKKALLGRAVVLIIAAAVIGMPAQAQRMEDCREHAFRAEEHLNHMLHRFGPRSDAARDARFDLEAIRQVCFRRDYAGRGGWRVEHDRTWHGDQRGPHH